MTSETRETSPHGNADNLRSTVDSGSDNVVQTSLVSLGLEERFAAKMFHYSKELCFFAAILFTTLAALHTSPPRVSKPPSARPFFNQSSLVVDFYKGHLGAAIEKVTDADLSFVMYYAPWDAESQAVRQEFEIVARFLHKQIFFAAINCWHPGSECRAQYSKIHSYPVLMLYPRRGPGIQYRGIRTAPYMIRFLHAFMNPIFRVTDKSQLLKLIVDYDAVVVGFFNFTGLRNSPGYNTFYKTAVKSLERDPNRELAFAAVTDVMSSKLYYRVTEFPSARLVLWNESLSYPLEDEWEPDSLLKGVSGALHQAALWLQPPGTKSLTLAPYLKDGPVLFLFTPRNPFHRHNHYYNLLKEIGLQYYNCGDNQHINDIVHNLERIRLHNKAKHYEDSKRCMQLLEKMKNPQPVAHINVVDRQWINNSCCAGVVMNQCLVCKKRIAALTDSAKTVCETDLNNLHHSCKPTDVFNVPVDRDGQERYEYCCDNEFETDDFGNSFFTEESDPQSANAITDFALKDDCRRLLTGNSYHPAVFPKDISHDLHKINLTSLICKTNKTLALIAVDSLQFFHIAGGLGIDISKKKDQTTVVIVDPLQESQYILEQDVSYNSLVQFINNYTQNMLERNLRSHSRVWSSTNTETQKECSISENSAICIPELTTDTFLKSVLDPEKDVVVMYYSPYCAFCQSVSHVYLTIAQYLRKMHNLTFVRINGDGNDLPWEYTMNRYPAILFFPAKRKADSTVFPFSLPITIPNLLNFVLANLDGDSHIEALVNICHQGIGESPADCVCRIRLLSLEIIEDLLRSYRRLHRSLVNVTKKIASKKLKVLLFRLQHIKEIHLTLGSISNLQIEFEKTQFIRDKFKSYYRELSAIDADNNVDRKVLSDNIVNIENGNVRDEL